MINYSIPGIQAHSQLNFRLLELMKIHPEYFYPNVSIEAVYGTFPWCVFDGGRIFSEANQLCIEEVKNITKIYNDFGVPIRLVYTNSQLEPKHYKNHFGNLVLETCQNDINQIVIADDNFLKYIKEKYPKYIIISSTTKCLNRENFEEELLKDDFAEVCLDYNLNKNMELLNKLSPDARKKCEFLCNAICPPGCPTRKMHYKLNSLYHLQYGRNYNVPYCGITNNILSPEAKAYHNNLSYDEISKIYEPMGFCHFKLEGRTMPDLTQACIYADYMIRPEYRTFAIDYLI